MLNDISQLHYYIACHEPLVGRIWSGTNTSYWYTWLHRKAFEKELGGKPIEGSLNIWFTQECVFPHPKRFHQPKAERWSPVYVQHVILSSNKKRFVRGLALRRGRRDSRAWIEVFSTVRIRKTLSLKDNDLVSVWML